MNFLNMLIFGIIPNVFFKRLGIKIETKYLFVKCCLNRNLLTLNNCQSNDKVSRTRALGGTGHELIRLNKPTVIINYTLFLHFLKKQEPIYIITV